VPFSEIFSERDFWYITGFGFLAFFFPRGACILHPLLMASTWIYPIPLYIPDFLPVMQHQVASSDSSSRTYFLMAYSKSRLQPPGQLNTLLVSGFGFSGVGCFSGCGLPIFPNVVDPCGY
jgi:hypothetical protein